MKNRPYEIVEINGLRTVLYPIVGFPAVKANLMVRAGSSFEAGPHWGAFHLIEHLCFEQTRKFKNWLDLESFKEEFGLKNNASTSNDLVEYWTYGPSESLEQALVLLSEMAFFTTLPKEGLPKQNSIIAQEYRGKWDQPNVRFARAIREQMFGKDHVYIRDGMGEPAFIQGLSQTELLELHQRYFTNENSVLIVVGDFEAKKAKKLIKELFTRNGGTKFDFVKQPIKPTVRKIIHHEDVQQNKLSLFWPFPGLKEVSFKERMFFRIGSYILGGSARSLLNRRLREELHLVYGCGFGRSNWPHGGFFEAWASMAPEKTDEVIKQIREVVYDFVKQPIDEAVFHRSLNFVKSNISLAFDSIQSVSGTISGDFYDDEVVRLPDEVIKVIEKATEKEVRELMAKYIKSENEYSAVMMKK